MKTNLPTLTMPKLHGVGKIYFFNAFSSVETIEDAYMVVDTYIEWLDNNGKEYVSPEEYIAFQYAFNTALHSINYWSFLN